MNREALLVSSIYAIQSIVVLTSWFVRQSIVIRILYVSIIINLLWLIAHLSQNQIDTSMILVISSALIFNCVLLQKLSKSQAITKILTGLWVLLPIIGVLYRKKQKQDEIQYKKSVEKDINQELTNEFTQKHNKLESDLKLQLQKDFESEYNIKKNQYEESIKKEYEDKKNAYETSIKEKYQKQKDSDIQEKIRKPSLYDYPSKITKIKMNNEIKNISILNKLGSGGSKNAHKCVIIDKNAQIDEKWDIIYTPTRLVTQDLWETNIIQNEKKGSEIAQKMGVLTVNLLEVTIDSHNGENKTLLSLSFDILAENGIYVIDVKNTRESSKYPENCTPEDVNLNTLLEDFKKISESKYDWWGFGRDTMNFALQKNDDKWDARVFLFDFSIKEGRDVTEQKESDYTHDENVDRMKHKTRRFLDHLNYLTNKQFLQRWKQLYTNVFGEEINDSFEEIKQ